MKLNAYAKDIKREFKGSISRFISIALMVCLGVGFFTGMKVTEPTMTDSAKVYFNENHLMDIKALSLTGFDDDDIKAIKNVSGIKDVMPSYSTDVLTKTQKQDKYYGTKVMALMDKRPLNDFIVVEGRLPKAEGECAICGDAFGASGRYSVGDVVKVNSKAGDTDVTTVLNNLEYKVVGIIKSPMYFSYNYGTTSIGDGSIYSYMCILQSEFLYSRYTEVYIGINVDRSLSPFGKDYNNAVKKVLDKLEPIGVARQSKFLDATGKTISKSQEEFDKQKAEAYKQLEDSQKKLASAKGELQNALGLLNSGWKEYNTQYASFEDRIKDGEKQMAAAEKELNAYSKQMADAEKQYNSAKATLDESKKQLDDAWAQYDAGAAEVEKGRKELADAKKQLEQGQALLSAGQTAMTVAKGLKTTADTAYKVAKPAYDILLRIGVLGAKSLDEAKALYEAGTMSQFQYQQFETTWNAFLAAQQLLDEADKALADAQKQIDDGNAQIAEGQKAAADAEKQLSDAEAQLNSSYDQLQTYQGEYDSGKAELDKAYKELTDGKKQLADGKAQLEQSKKELAEAKKTGTLEFTKSKNQLDSSQKQYDDGMSEYTSGLEQYEIAKAETERKLSDGAAQIANAQSMLTELSYKKWYLFNRGDALSNYNGYGQDAGRIGSIAGIFPVFFLLVAILVCVTTMSRMVEEQRAQMGAYKALGYSNAHIFRKYLLYAVLASVIGGIIGQAVCIPLFPRVIINAYSLMYAIPINEISIVWPIVVIALIAGIACTSIVTYICCRKEISTNAAYLMRPKAPKAGKTIFIEKIKPVWNSLNFASKITVRNLFRYKVRFWMTIIGITGCMSLILSGFGLQNAISPLVSLQFDDIYHYDYQISILDTYVEDDIKDVKSTVLKKTDTENCLFTNTLSVTAKSKAVKESVSDTYVFVPQDDKAFKKLYTLKDSKTGKTLALKNGEAIITQKLAKELSLSKGDTITFNHENIDYKVKVGDVVDNYLYHYIYMTPATYEDVFDKDVTYNGFVGNTKSGKVDAESILAVDSNFVAAIRTADMISTMDDNFTSLYFVIAVLVICATLLAIVVLYNLTNINICERAREIATTKVLGFTRKESDMYIFRENIIMTIIGIIFGCVCGTFLAQLMINMVETDMVAFSHRVLFTSYLYSCLITAATAGLILLVMRRKIRKIDMVEALKSIE